MRVATDVRVLVGGAHHNTRRERGGPARRRGTGWRLGRRLPFGACMNQCAVPYLARVRQVRHSVFAADCTSMCTVWLWHRAVQCMQCMHRCVNAEQLAGVCRLAQPVPRTLQRP